jgi:3-(3-hydroxy-phenyl)propionate hydroxylase
MLPNGFILLLAGDVDAPPALLRQAREIGVVVHRIARNPSEAAVEEDGLLASWLSAKDACAVLVRPDHIVFGTAADVRQTERLLRELHSVLAA